MLDRDKLKAEVFGDDRIDESFAIDFKGFISEEIESE